MDEMIRRGQARRWIRGFEALARRSRQELQAKRRVRVDVVGPSLELMELVCRVEDNPVARARREREVAAVRALWLRLARAEASKPRRRSGRSAT